MATLYSDINTIYVYCMYPLRYGFAEETIPWLKAMEEEDEEMYKLEKENYETNEEKEAKKW